MTPLSSRDLVALAHAQRVVLGPLDHPTPEAWMGEVLGALQTLFQAERGIGTVSGAGGVAFVTSGVEARALAAYEAEFAGTDRAGDLVTSQPAPYYAEEDVAADPRFAAHVSSAVYNEWYRAHGLTRTVGMFVLGNAAHVPDLYEGVGAPVVANVLLAGTPLSVGQEVGRARTMLALLQPALAASVDVWQVVSRETSRLAAVLDGLRTPVWLYDRGGRLVHESGEAARQDVGGKLRATAHRLAAGLSRGARAGQPATSTAGATVGGEHVRLVGTYVSAKASGDPAILVTPADQVPALPNVEALRGRFGLTRQQARVARLLASRRSTAEVGEALSISVHTVRRHTEQVLSRLGVARREDVQDAVRGL